MSPSRPTAGEIEQRDAPAASVDGRRLRGLIPYGQESRDLGGWTEVIEPGALRGARLDDLVATVDHVGVPIGRYPRTLEVEDRSDGLHWSVEPPESRADVREAVERGDLQAGSWRMVVGREEWRGDVRHVHEISELRDVSVVSSPAYGAATVEFRSAENVDNNGGERRQEEGTMPEENTGAADEQRAENENEGAEERSQTTEAEARSEERSESRAEGTLRVEDRNETTETRSIEDRIGEELRTVRKGESRALTTSASISPEELSTALFDGLRAASVGLRSGIRVLTTQRDSVTFPHLSADVAPGWFAEGAEITAGDPTLGTVKAEPHKLAHRVVFSNEVLDDSDPSVVDVLRQHLTTLLGLKLDIGIFTGSGEENQPTGLQNVESTEEVGEIGTPTNLDFIAEAVEKLQVANAMAGAIVLHPRDWGTIRTLKDEDKRYLLAPDPSTDAVGRIFGVPVYLTSQLPIKLGEGEDESVGFVYDPSQVFLVRRQDVEVELDRSRLFHEDESEMRGKLRADLIVPNPSAVVELAGLTA